MVSVNAIANGMESLMPKVSGLGPRLDAAKDWPTKSGKEEILSDLVTRFDVGVMLRVVGVIGLSMQNFF